MSLGEKIAESVPGPVITWFYEHPRAVCALTGLLFAVSVTAMLTASELDVHANDWRKARLGEIQIAASEALGG